MYLLDLNSFYLTLDNFCFPWDTILVVVGHDTVGYCQITAPSKSKLGGLFLFEFKFEIGNLQTSLPFSPLTLTFCHNLCFLIVLGCVHGLHVEVRGLPFGQSSVSTLEKTRSFLCADAYIGQLAPMFLRISFQPQKHRISYMGAAASGLTGFWDLNAACQASQQELQPLTHLPIIICSLIIRFLKQPCDDF